MSRRVYIEYRDSGNLTNAYSVELASEDGFFGIKESNSNTVIVSSGTVVSNPSTGVYEYYFNPVDGIKYTVSWKVLSSPSAAPRWVSQVIGPFSEYSSPVTASSDYIGTFKQGTLATMMLKITDFDGVAQDPTAILAMVYDVNDAVIETITPEKAKVGFYVFDWSIPENQAVGNYKITWTYTVDGTQRTEVQNAIVVGDIVDTELYTGLPYEIRLGLESYIECAQNIPVYFEQSRPSVDSKTFRFTFPRWNQTSGVKIYRNQKEIVIDGLNINYFKGEVTFSNPLTSYDILNADYNFRWFSDVELQGFIVNAIRTLNSYAPHSGYNIYNIPDRYIPVVQKQAAVDAIRKMMMCLQFQQPQQIFGGAEGAAKAFENLRTTKENYESEIKIIYEQKKLGPYVGLTRTIVTPEFTLPGGRSRWFRYLFSSGV